MSPAMLKSFFEPTFFPVIVIPLQRLPLDTDTKFNMYQDGSDLI